MTCLMSPTYEAFLEWLVFHENVGAYVLPSQIKDVEVASDGQLIMVGDGWLSAKGLWKEVMQDQAVLQCTSDDEVAFWIARRMETRLQVRKNVQPRERNRIAN